jgi:hypothetical protein
MTISRIFKSSLPSMNYVFKDGMSAVFLGGKFSTDIDHYIKEMMQEVGVEGTGKSRHPYIYVDLDEKEIDSEALTPLEIIKAEALAQARAELAAAMDITKKSESESKNFASSIASSQNIAQASASDSGSPVTISAAEMIAAARAGAATKK